MTRGNARPPWWAVPVSGACGAAVAVTVMVLAGMERADVRAAAVQRPAAVEESTGSQPDETPEVTFVGDSWTWGSGATSLRGYAVLTGQQLGWEYHVLGEGGSGYSLRGGQGTGTTFADRIDRAVASDADVIVVQGSLNERNSTREALANAAVDTLARLRAEAAPETRILVLGAPYNPGTPDETIDWINDAIEDAADRAGVEFVDVAGENWTDPVVRSIWADPIHPNDAGHQLIADRLAPLLESLMDH